MRDPEEIRAQIAAARGKEARLIADMKAVDHRAGERNLTAGEQQNWDRLERGVKAAGVEIEHLTREWGQAIEHGIATGRVAIEHGDGANPDRGWGADRLGQRRDAAMFTVDGHVRSGVLPAAAGELVEKLVSRGSTQERSFASRWVETTGSEAYWAAFEKWWRDPQMGHLLWNEAERSSWQHVQELKREQRAMSLTDAAGGYGTLPYQLDPSIILTGGSISPMREISRKVTTMTDKWRGVTSAGATASWDAEAAEVSDDAPTLAQPEIAVHRLQTFVPFSRELEEDWDGPSLMTELARVLVDAADRLQATAFTTGTGSGQPKGLVTALASTASELNVITPETFSVADIYALIEALPARWRPNARWMANLSVINDISVMETGNGARLFPEVGSASPLLLRRPLHENSIMDGTWDTGATANNYVLVVGDFEQFVIVDKPFSSSVELVPHLFGSNQRPTGQRGAYLYMRTGSDVTTVDAFRMLDLPTTA